MRCDGEGGCKPKPGKFESELCDGLDGEGSGKVSDWKGFFRFEVGENAFATATDVESGSAENFTF